MENMLNKLVHMLSARRHNAVNKRVAALLVALSLMSGMLPTFAPSAAATDGKPAPVLLDFSQLKSAKDSANNNKWTITEYGNANFTINMAKSYHASHRVFYGSANGGFSAPHIDVGTPDVSWLKMPDRRLTIDFNVPASGIYTIDLTGGKWYAGGIADVFIDDQYLGDYDFCNYDESNTLPRTMGEKKVLRTVALTGGEHEISLRTRGGGMFNYTYLIPYQIHMTPAEELAQIDQVIGSVEKESMDVAESQTLTGRVQMTDGASYSFGYTDDGQEKQDEIVTVESSDPATVEVSAVSLREAGKAGEFSAQLTAKAVGSANITVSVRLGAGEAKTTVVPITVAGGEAEPTPVLLDFSQLKSAQDSANDNRWTITEYGNANFTIDMAKSYHASHRVFYGSANGGFSAPHIDVGTPDVSWLTTPNRRLTIDFDVPASGIYTIDLTGGKWYAGGIADVFIDDQYLGDYDFCNYDESNTLPRSMGEKKVLRTVALTGGEA